MEPRLKSSQKWTSLPREILKQIREVFTKAFPEASQKGQFLGEGRIYKEELLLRVGYHVHGKLQQNNFEVSMEYNSKKDNMINLIHLGIDVCASLFSELFENHDVDEFPRIWQEFEVENRKVYVQYSGVNSELEKQADLILKKQDQSLVQGEDDEDLESEKQGLKRILGLDPDED